MTPLAFCAQSLNPLDIYFFECVVVRNTWMMVSSVVGVEIGSDYENFAK
jgi:hypothetical protein